MRCSRTTCSVTGCSGSVRSRPERTARRSRPDGRTVYLPTGERTNDDVWYVVDARTGLVRSEIHAGPGPHNTIVSPDGRRVYLGPRNSRYLDVVSTRTNRLIRRIGPLRPRRQAVHDQRPTDTRVHDCNRIPRLPGVEHSYRARPLHGSDSRLPTRAVARHTKPRHLPLAGQPKALRDRRPEQLRARLRRFPGTAPATEAHRRHSPQAQNGRQGATLRWRLWPRRLATQSSLDGRYVYVGDSGDVIDTGDHCVAAFLPALRNSRYQFELDWCGNVPVQTSSRSGIGRLR